MKAKPAPTHTNQDQSAPTVYSVSTLNLLAKTMLEKQLGTVWIEGEISNFVRASSGHFYFSLKDDSAQIRAAMFRGDQQGIGFKPQDGQRVLARAQVSLYAPRGDFQLIVQHMELAGIGQLLAKFEELKKKLAAEGLFDASRKKPLPPYPETIGIVTSPTGAAIKDILQVLNRRYPLANIRIYPCLVQGEGAAIQLTKRLKQASHDPLNDVVILARGGGSIEDLWAFNDEQLARAVAASPIPVVTGVGHETDFTLVDFVADLRAPTPSAAAEHVSPDGWELAQWIDQTEEQITGLMLGLIEQHQIRLNNLSHRLTLQHPAKVLDQIHDRLNQLTRRLFYRMTVTLDTTHSGLNHLSARLHHRSPAFVISQQQARIENILKRLILCISNLSHQSGMRINALSQRLNNVSPLNTLSRGFTITRNPHTHEALHTITAALSLETLSIQFQDGEMLVKPSAAQ